MQLSGNNFARALVLLLFVFALSCPGSGYSVLTHEQVVRSIRLFAERVIPALKGD